MLQAAGASMKRILLVHAYHPSMAPIAEAFATGWPEAQVLNLLDEALYSDVSPEGVMDPDIPERVASILRHAEKSRADGVVFTGSTFGPAVDAAKTTIGIPVLKADEAMAEIIAEKAEKPVIVCTARRALPVIRGNIEAKVAERGRVLSLGEWWVAGAKDAIVAGDNATHDRLIAEAVKNNNAGHDMIAFGQVSMVPAKRLLTAEIAARVITSAEASVIRMRELVGDR
jgi:hypothetical protein